MMENKLKAYHASWIQSPDKINLRPIRLFILIIHNKILYAEIIIPLALPKNYTWLIPDHLMAGLQPGCRVEVSLKNKKYAGIVKKFLT